MHPVLPSITLVAHWIGQVLPVLALAFIAGLCSVYLLLRLFRHMGVFDHPHPRKEHRHPIPTMGGLAIIGGTGCGMLLLPQGCPLSITSLFCLAAIACTGIIDDCRDLHAVHKLCLQGACAALLVAEGFRLQHLHGIFGSGTMPLIAQYAFTIIVITAVTNAFNLADGIDGLAGGLSLISLLILGCLLLAAGDLSYSLTAFALAGALLGFLYFNMQPARIFMGDTGSLFLGFTIALLCLRLLQVVPQGAAPLPQPILLCFAVVALPLMDAVRLFFARILRHRSPFAADRNHMHHILVAKGYSHRLASLVLMGLHYLLIGMAFLSQQLPAATALMQMMLVPVLAIAILQRLPSSWAGSKQARPL